MSLFFTKRFYIAAWLIVLLFVAAYIYSPLFVLAKIVFGLAWIVVGFDIWQMYRRNGEMSGRRECTERFSNGDENQVLISFCNPYPFRVGVEVIDEAPVQFQLRNLMLTCRLAAAEEKTLGYTVVPKRRGEYKFDRIRIFFTSPLGLVMRRFTVGESQTVKVYPSYTRLSNYAFLAIRRNLREYGIKKVRRVGVDTEFEQIKDYVIGDEYRNINWKASARTAQLKVNVYQQERSQDIYCIIDKGRMMQQSFDKMSLLEYAINSALALSYVAVKKEDKAGLVTFSDQFDTFLPPARGMVQMHRMMDSLYRQQTIFSESDYSALAVHFLSKVTKRSLIILYANFATAHTMKRELPYLRQIAERHRLVVVIFADSSLRTFADGKAVSEEEYFQRLLAERFIDEKKNLIAKMHQMGIDTVYTTPDNLSVDMINKYLQIRHF